MNKEEKEMFSEMKAMMKQMQEELITLKKGDTKPQPKKTSSKKQSKKVEDEHKNPYQSKSKILEAMTPKQLSKYIPKTALKTPKPTKEKSHPFPFPMKAEQTKQLFHDFDIAGMPWISYYEQLDLLDKMMKHYKYTIKSKIAKYNDIINYLGYRETVVADDDKLKKGAKRNRLNSIANVRAEANRRLEKLI